MATIVTRAGKGSALSHNEVDANFTNLNSDKLEANSNITVANATVTGDLTVQGTTTTLNTATLQVEDKNITLNYSTGDSSGSADGAGITIQDAVSSSTDATILWDATNDTFDFSHAIQVQGLVDIASGEIGLKNSGSVSNIKFYCEVGNAHYTALQSSPHSAYSGNVTLTLPPATDTLVGRATTDTLTNKTLTSPTVNGGTHTSFTSTGIDDNATSTAITIDSNENVGIGGDGNAKLEVFGPLASPSLGTYANSAAIISTTAGGYGMSFSVDGTGTGYIQAQNFTSSTAYKLSLNSAGGNVGINEVSPDRSLHVNSGSETTNAKFESTGSSVFLQLTDDTNSAYIGADAGALLFQTPGSSFSTKLTIASDGAATFASGINATSINTTATNVFAIASGQPFYWKDTNATNGTQCNVYSYWYAQSTTLGYIGYGSSSHSHLVLSNATVGSLYFGATTANGFLANGNVMWHAGNDGSGSGLDADTLDGYNSAESGAGVVLRTNNSGYVAHNNWISIGNGTGLYMANGAYFYNDTTYGWYSRSPNSGSSSIRLQNVSGTAIGWLYCTNSYIQSFLNSTGGYAFQVDNSGNATATGNVTAYSDIRLKENIQPLENSLDKVMRLRGVSYTRKDTGSHEIGVIAQEVEQVIPEFVHITDGVAMDENALSDVRSVDYGRMVSVLIEAIKEQQAQIEELKEAVKWQ